MQETEGSEPAEPDDSGLVSLVLDETKPRDARLSGAEAFTRTWSEYDGQRPEEEW